MKNESQFENDFAKSAAMQGMQYLKIKDTRSINAENRRFHKEVQRPFDGILFGKNGTLCIEAKYRYNKLADHQLAIGKMIEDKNGMFCVIRKIDRKASQTVYRCEDTDGKVYFDKPDLITFVIAIKNEFNL